MEVWIEMSLSDPFADIPVLGRMTRAEAAAKLKEVDDQDSAIALESHSEEQPESGKNHELFSLKARGWQHTAHALGYLPSVEPGQSALAIQHAGNIMPDVSLKHKQIKVMLNGLRVADYPGKGDHRILFDFYSQNQTSSGIEHVHFNSTYRAREGESVAAIGYPIFRGLNVGKNGLAFRCFTVNIKNEQDESTLAVFESDVFKGGLLLAETMQPAIAPLSKLAVSLVKSLAKRTRNVPVQDFYLGLDFSNIPGGARLATGLYVAVQIPQSVQQAWEWRQWEYLPSSGQIVRRGERGNLIPYNYVAFGIDRYEQ